MAKPTKPVAPTPALRSNPDAFRVNAEANILFLFTTLLDYVSDVADFTDEQATAALAAAIGGDLPPIVGNALKFIRLNAGETEAEFISAPLATRSIVGTTDQITVVNGDGVAGDPTLSAVFASQAEAEAGTDTVKFMNALRVAQAILAAIATQAEAEAGTNNTKLMTPLRTSQQIVALVGPALDEKADEWEFIDTLFDYAVDGAVSSVETPLFEDGYDYMIVATDLDTTNGSTPLNIQGYLETNASWSVACALVNTLDGTEHYARAILCYPYRVTRGHATHIASVRVSTNTTTGKSDTVAMGLGTAQRLTKARVIPGAGTLNGGSIRMWRRLNKGDY